jgi:hypothetical protein
MRQAFMGFSVACDSAGTIGPIARLWPASPPDNLGFACGIGGDAMVVKTRAHPIRCSCGCDHRTDSRWPLDRRVCHSGLPLHAGQ